MTVNRSVTEDFCPSIVLNLIVTEPRQSLNERLCNVLMWSPLSSYTVLPKQNGRVAIVTGGTRGIGFETARHLASLGMHVIIGRLMSDHIPSLSQFPFLYFFLVVAVP